MNELRSSPKVNDKEIDRIVIRLGWVSDQLNHLLEHDTLGYDCSTVRMLRDEFLEISVRLGNLQEQQFSCKNPEVQKKVNTIIENVFVD